jgi:hypothetical protein
MFRTLALYPKLIDKFAWFYTGDINGWYPLQKLFSVLLSPTPVIKLLNFYIQTLFVALFFIKSLVSIKELN